MAGCSLLVPLDAASGGADDPDAKTPDLGDANDANTSGDTTIDAKTDGGSGAALVCPTGALICDDFERDDLAGTGVWKVTGVDISNALAYSPTRSITLNQPSVSFTTIEKIFNSPPFHLRVSFRLHAGKAPPGFVEIMKMPFGPAYQWDTATLGLGNEGLNLGLQRYDGDPGPSASDGKTAVPAATLYGSGFRAVVWEIDLRGDEKIVRASVDGGPATELRMGGHTPSVAPAVFAIGTLYRSDEGAIVDTYIDDVVVEAL